MYEELISQMRGCCEYLCGECKYEHLLKQGNTIVCMTTLIAEAADAIEELLKAANAMHTWIFLHAGDEQAVYDECGLRDELNAKLGYGGQMIVELLKEEYGNDV